jgi:hypothetical protein
MFGWITAATKAETNCVQQKLNMLTSRSEIFTEKHKGHCGHWNMMMMLKAMKAYGGVDV